MKILAKKAIQMMMIQTTKKQLLIDKTLHFLQTELTTLQQSQQELEYI